MGGPAPGRHRDLPRPGRRARCRTWTPTSAGAASRPRGPHARAGRGRRAARAARHELEAADAILIGAPMYNFTIPSTLKAWLDQVDHRRPHHGRERPPPPAPRPSVVASRGGGYGPGTPREDFEFVQTYLEKALTGVSRPGRRVHHPGAHPGPGQPGDGRLTTRRASAPWRTRTRRRQGTRHASPPEPRGSRNWPAPAPPDRPHDAKGARPPDSAPHPCVATASHRSPGRCRQGRRRSPGRWRGTSTRPVAVQLAEDHGRLRRGVLGEVVAGELGAAGLVDDADERVAHLAEALAAALGLVDGDGEDDLVDLGRAPPAG